MVLCFRGPKASIKCRESSPHSPSFMDILILLEDLKNNCYTRAMIYTLTIIPMSCLFFSTFSPTIKWTCTIKENLNAKHEYLTIMQE